MNAHKPETDRHLDAGARNLGFAVALLGGGVNLVTPPPYDWVLIVSFYASVRYVNALHWESFDYDPTDHIARNGFVNKALMPIADPYFRLYGRSRVVRYSVINSPVNEPAARAAISIAERVRDEVARFL